MVQPMKAALYLDSVKGFGQWRILISSRADKMLRKARRADKRTFEIMIRKIKELSKGHFSADNQKRLNGPSTGVPIFEAKMTRDLRLVYQIDCAPDNDGDGEIQVIKIYGLYTHAQLDGRFWNSVSHQLTRHGKAYNERCNQRNRQAGSDVILPCTFPPREVSAPVETEYVIDLPAEVWEDIHSLLHLDKYVVLSQALLYSMLADLDVQHVFSVSSQEREIIEHPYSCYVLGRSGTGKTTTMLFKMLGIERAWEQRAEEVPKVRQLFVTKSRILAEKVEEYFAKLMVSLSTGSKSPEELKALAEAQRFTQEREALVDKDDEVYYRSDLPAQFSLLTEEHFPLFITFDQLCKLLEADIAGHATQSYSNKKFISATVFSHHYWPRFPRTLTKHLDSSMVFSEFIGVIKGSEEALGYKGGFLDQQGYENLSSRTQPAFANQRASLYKIFQDYLKLKKKRGDYDTADRTRALIRALHYKGIPGQAVDYLYVDEAQDNLLIDAMILRALCKNPHGLFWAGDTAQTISVGSSFRFDDLKAFLFRIEQESTMSPGTIGGIREGPRMFQLAVNYRSHGGIVNCAHSIIELITRFWPYAIDNLAPEQGTVDGLKPTFISAQDQDTATYKRFLFGDKESHIEFGAEQCVIVRNEAARNELREQVGDIGLVMTPYETKGLEFNDVLLYNFFQDSAMDFSQWRVILNALEPSQRSTMGLPCFDETRHAGLCSELKILYVSITRARRNIWIVDSSETAEPMRVFWTSKDLVMTRIPETTGWDSLAVSSSREEWEKTGRSLFKQKRYAHAAQCLQRASMTHEAAVASAYLLREQAHAVSDSIVLRSEAFGDAAAAFNKCALLTTVESRAYYRIAAECFQECGKFSEAARLYIKMEDSDSAAQAYLKAEMFDQAIQVVRENQDKMQGNVVSGIVHASYLHYWRRQEFSQAIALFSSVDHALEFMEKHKFNEARVYLLKKIGRMADAVNVLLSIGRDLDAHQLLVQDFESKSSMHRVTQYILSNLRKILSLGFLPKRKKTQQAVADLLQLATSINTALVDPNDCDELSMFKAIMSMDQSQLRQLGQNFFRRTNTMATVLCFDHVYHAISRTIGVSAQQAMVDLPFLLEYARLRFLDPCKDSSIQSLLGVQKLSKNVFLIPIQTTLHTVLKNFQMLPQCSTDEGMRMSGAQLCCAAGTFFQNRLRHPLSLVITIKVLKDWPLPTSLRFLRQVVYDKLPVDHGVLCDTLEYFCASFIISMKYQKTGLLHDVVLPCKWLLFLVRNVEECNSRDTRLFYLLVDPLAEFLSTQIYSTDPNSRALLSRICRCLCLLGYNHPTARLQLQILRVINSLPKNISSPYVNARTWSQLSQAVRMPNPGFPAENLVELYHEGQVSVATLPDSGVTRVIYKDVHEIPGLLTNLSSNPKSYPILPGKARGIDETVSKVEDAIKDVVEDAGYTEVTEFQDAQMDSTGWSEHGRGLDDNAPASDFILSEARKHAARVIIYAYRRFVSRRRGVGRSGLSAKLDRLFCSCLEEAQRIGWNSREPYRKVYLGALPPILLCLEEARKITFAAKADVKEHSKDVELLEREDLGKRRTELVKALKTMDQLHRTLDPKSNLHREPNMSLLTTSALEVQALLLQFPPKDVGALKTELALALNAIMKPSGYLAAAK